jgi:hypothetical protein
MTIGINQRLAALPPSQQEALQRVQNALLSDIATEAAKYERALAAEVRAAISRLRKLKFKPEKVRKELRRIFAKADARLQAIVLGLVDDAARYADTYALRLMKYNVTQTHPLKPHEIAWATQGLGGGAARAAIAYARGRTAGDKGALFSQRGKLALSNRIHKMTRQELEEVTSRVVRAIREGQSLAFASRELVAAAPTGLAKGESFPKLIRQIKKKFAKLDKLTGGGLTTEKRRLAGYLKALERGQKVDLRKLRDTAARVKDLEYLYKAAAKEEVPKIRKYYKKLKGGIPDKKLAEKLGVSRIKAGRMQGAWLSLADDLEAGKAAEASIKRWAYSKQRYRAETVMYSESVAAFRQRQVQFAEDREWIIAYRVVLTRGRHARFVAQKPGKLKALGGAHCLCETYDGKLITLQEFKEQWYRGFHPNCGCQFLEVVDRSRMLSTPVTDRERQEYAARHES